MANLFTRIAERVYREYDRRIRRASLITAYGAAHHHAESAHHEEPEHTADEGDVAIANLPLGAELPAAPDVAEQTTGGTHE